MAAQALYFEVLMGATSGCLGNFSGVWQNNIEIG
jgi:hypothetical protein